MPTMAPMPNSFQIEDVATHSFRFKTGNTSSSASVANTKRHHTSDASCNEMSLPSMAVKPASNTAICNLI